MITRLGVEDRNLNSTYSVNPKKNADTQNLAFKGGWALPLLLKGIQECEKNPMVNVAVIDLFSAILPRTFVESLTNWFAGFEALRRESSGLIVNCLIPSFITLGIAKLLNNFIMPKGSNMSGCWADSSLIERASEMYKSSNGDKVKDTFKEIISNIEGVDGKKRIVAKDVLTKAEIETMAEELKALSKSSADKKQFTQKIESITNHIVEKTHVYENITVGSGEKAIKASNVKTLLEDSTKFFKEFRKAGHNVSIEEFAKQSKKLVGTKSALGLLVVLPLAASMQYINRWLTEKMSGVKGAPIYDDFGKDQNEEVKQKSKEGLMKQKIISISSMLAVGFASMMKLPKWSMFEFKGMFPTMDQARLISTTTFASRMAAADDKNELAEATTRDIATFLSLYFLGDYAAKGTATIIEKKLGIKLLNDMKPLEEGAGPLKRFWHWMKNVNIKSSEEVVSKTAEELKAKGLTPNKEQAEKIAKELKRAVNLRSACQVASIGVSLVLLGLIIPIWTRSKTKKKHAEALQQVQTASSNVNDIGNDKEAKTLPTQQA